MFKFKIFVKPRGLLIAFWLLWYLPGFNQEPDSVYLFSYFTGNGADGLHLASSTDGLQWTALANGRPLLKPVLSGDSLMRDPCIIRGADGRFHMVWTVSWNERGIGYAVSDDLVHWSLQQYLPVMAHEKGARNCWAPEITYIPEKKKYLIYWATTIDGRYPQKDMAAESGYNHRMYYVTTRNFQKFSKTKLLYEPGFSVIDASIQKVGRRYVMWLKNETRSPVEKNIRLANAKRYKGHYGKPSAPITGNYWAEGPTALWVKGYWMVYFDKYRDHQYGAVRSSDLQHWTDISDRIHMPAGLRHGTAFTVDRLFFEQLQQALLAEKP